MNSKEFLTGDCEDRTSARDSEESPILDALDRKRLVKTREAGKGLSCGVVHVLHVNVSDQ
jgi:hypothetical protein